MPTPKRKFSEGPNGSQLSRGFWHDATQHDTTRGRDSQRDATRWLLFNRVMCTVLSFLLKREPRELTKNRAASNIWTRFRVWRGGPTHLPDFERLCDDRNIQVYWETIWRCVRVWKCHTLDLIHAISLQKLSPDRLQKVTQSHWHY